MNQVTSQPPRPGAHQRLFDWIKGLERVPQRYAGSVGERQSAELVAGWMRGLGLPQVGTETFSPPKRSGRSGYLLALHTLIAGIGCLIGGWWGTALLLLAAWSIRGPRWGNIGAILPGIRSVNAVGHRPATEANPFRIILSAHIDTNQAGLIFHPGWPTPSPPAPPPKPAASRRRDRTAFRSGWRSWPASCSGCRCCFRTRHHC
ncbi:hypothetical protein [Marinobacterium aestuariivivens]|uniref:Peptidase M28 domain-containing protein n=1 Tax=Marinobacterium aestuariivivens TaxID=1698799 RepID=A0ABW1ZUK7_9GAMM